MKKIFFLLISLLFINNVSANNAADLTKIVNRCGVIKDKEAVIPVRVISKNNGGMTKLIDTYNLGFTDNNDNLDVTINNIKGDGIEKVYLDNKTDDEGRSLIYYKINKDINVNKYDEVFSFNIVVNFKEEVKDEIYVLGNLVTISDKETCDVINEFEITEFERFINNRNDKKDFEKIILYGLVIVLGGLLIIILIKNMKKKKI